MIITAPTYFPHPDLVHKSGVLAYGGDLHPETLLLAYQYGIFPWYNQEEPIIWWCPSPRYVIFPDQIKVAKSMNSYFNQSKYRVTYNQCFDEVIRRCMSIRRPHQEGTWITTDIILAYTQLYDMGYITSVEVWDGHELCGGLYGVNIGRVFFGESMFASKPNASKFGFLSLARHLAQHGYEVIDCQQPNPHLESLGGQFVDGSHFQDILRHNRMWSLSHMDRAVFKP
jgi:leucyl/phenylalanyl-tRNA---protein transferase